MRKERINKLQNLLKQDKLDALALIAGTNISYFCDLDFHLSERPVILLISRQSQSILFHPALESNKVKKSAIPLKSIPYGENPKSWPETLKTISKYIDIEIMKIGVIPTSMRFLELQLLQETFKRAKIIPATDILSKLCIIKDKSEIESIRNAVKIAETAIKNLLPFITIGRSEREIAAELVVQLLHAGSEPNLPFMPIVASGPNSADPHALPSGRKLKNGDLIIIDWGARYQGYISDITRTFAIGKIENKLTHIANIVKDANKAARDKIKPGISTSEIDFAARNFITQKGYGNYFIHRTGHGIGLETHESPYISQSNKQILKPRMAFTIEPGIYIAGEGGVRIEDDVVVTEESVETITRLPRQLHLLK